MPLITNVSGTITEIDVYIDILINFILRIDGCILWGCLYWLYLGNECVRLLKAMFQRRGFIFLMQAHILNFVKGETKL